jgi:tyrosine-protein kinase Etk/Wzc
MSNNDFIPSKGEEEAHFLDYVIVLAKHSRMIIYTGALLTLLTLGYLLTQPNQYNAKATILPPQQNVTLSGQLLDSLGVSSGVGAGAMAAGGGLAAFLGLKSPGDLYVGILNGTTVFDRIIDRFNLKEAYEQEVLEKVRKKLAARSDIKAGKDGLITIEVTDESPQKAADMANAFVEELDRLLQEIAVKDANNQLAFLEKEREQTNLNLTRAENALKTFSENSSIIQIDAQAKGMLEYIAQLRATIDAKEVQLQVMRKHATPSNYDLIRTETELKGLRDKLKAAEGQMADQACAGDVCIVTGKIPSLGLEYFRLYREVKYQETLFQLFSKMMELARIDAARNLMVEKVQTVDKAVQPGLKSKPKRAIISLIIGIITTIFMVFVAFGREYWNKVSQTEAARFQELSHFAQPWQQKMNKLLTFCRLKKK